MNLTSLKSFRLTGRRLLSLQVGDPLPGETLGPQPDTIEPDEVVFSLALLPASGVGNTVPITALTDLSSYDLSSGEYMLQVTADSPVALMRVSANGVGSELFEVESGIAYENGIRVPGDKWVVSVQAYSDVAGETDDVLGSRLFEFDL